MPHSTLPSSRIERYRSALEPLAKAFDLVNDYVVITDADAHILYVNRAIVRHTGFRVDEVLGKNPADLWGGRMPRAFYEELWRNIKEKRKPFATEVCNTTRKGRDCWHDLHISPVLDAKGEVELFIAIEPSINDRKRKERFREEFASVIGHESLSPATAIRWMIEWLAENGNLNNRQKKKLHEIYAQHRRLVDMINDLLFLSRLGRGYPAQEEVDLAAELHGILKSKRHQFPRVTFTLTATPESQSFLVHSYRSLVAQLLSIPLEEASLSLRKQTGTVTATLKKTAEGYRFECTVARAGLRPDPGSARMTTARMIARYIGWHVPERRNRKKEVTWQLTIPPAAATRHL
ncbi:MAG: multi-sensor hybrid histidine kinase [Candidatus Peregrinibacteria bacterium Greene0416_19]|nr:MAG: multi-sensor hybrid histidine kinase [Candidatus Peregrinibacteria bacterium Greene0416_19]